jgi:flavin reductase (DIM6/NTAB) family NADH-FMN oxidoreductase RutF
MHKDIEPAILYFGTPVVLVSTLNADGSANIAPISSIWWIGWSCMIGVDASSQTTENLTREGECVLNLPSGAQVEQVNRIAKTTGRPILPLHKKALGYRFEKDKFGISGFTPQPSVTVKPPRIQECPVQLEATLAKCTPFGERNRKMGVPTAALELSIERVHVEEALLAHPDKPYVDPDKWHPLIMSFRQFYSTGGYIHPSKLSEGAENQYAPWKRKGPVGTLITFLLARNTAPYKRAVAKRSEN